MCGGVIVETSQIKDTKIACSWLRPEHLLSFLLYFYKKN